MTILVDLLRPDDLLNLRIETVNLKLDTDDPAHPVVIADDAEQPSYLIVNFPPQAIVEEAFYQSSAVKAPPADASKPYNQKPPSANLPAPDAGARARIGGPSRLVFRVPPDARIPYTIDGLLNWEDLSLNVSAIADMPEVPTDREANVAPAIKPPDKVETALELPYRLILSPAHGVSWDHAHGLKTHAGRTELWHTRLALRDAAGHLVPLSRRNPAPLRVIWSPDYNAKKFTKFDQPVMGVPDLDWNHPPGVLTAMTPSDRHELVVLTSAFHGFIKGLRDDGSIDYSAFRPTPVHAELLILSPLGGWLRSRGNWRPPTPWKTTMFEPPRPRRSFDELVKALSRAGIQHLRQEAPGTRRAGDIANMADVVIAANAANVAGGLAAIDPHLLPAYLGTAGDSLNLSEWVHIATQGRDHYVRIVYEGFVYPFRHRAALVKVTERKISDGKDGAPVAYLAQRLFVVIRQPLMDYGDERAADGQYGRHMPVSRIRLTTLITPDIDPPAKIAGSYTFWINVNNEPFRFHAVGEDIGGNQIDFTTALIFIPFSDYGATTVADVRTKHLSSGVRRLCPVPGQQVTFADRKAAHPRDNTTLTTQALHFNTDSKSVGGGFTYRPLLLKAAVKLPAVEQLLGTNAPAEIAYYQEYLALGFDAANRTGLFAHIAKETAPGALSIDKVQAAFSADQAGGVSTPNLSISGITRELGPLAGDDLTKLAGSDFNPADFFKDVKDAAKLFGSISIIDLLRSGSMDVGAPKVQLSEEAVAGSPNKKRLVATLEWTPEVQNASAGIVHLTVTPGVTKMSIKGRVERLIEVPPSPNPGPSGSMFEGELTDFTVDLLNVVALLFTSFTFRSEAGRKPIVNIALQGDEPVRFEGDLEFVNTLKEFIPPGLFGDGASLDVSPTRVKAGFGIGLPPIAVGVFSLSGISLNAAIELPFLEGKPLFDFAVSSREHPFSLIVAFLGGGGFFHLQLDTDGIRQLEAALEFGASASINLGVASGGVHIMAGVYFAMGKKNGVEFSVLAGYLRLGGELSVLGLISISLEFNLCFAYEDGKAAGRATLTVKVEVVFFSTSVEISVEKRFGGSSGDPRFFQVFETPAVWSQYASAFA
jgi:hypothetical protein